METEVQVEMMLVVVKVTEQPSEKCVEGEYHQTKISLYRVVFEVVVQVLLEMMVVGKKFGVHQRSHVAG